MNRDPRTGLPGEVHVAAGSGAVAEAAATWLEEVERRRTNAGLGFAIALAGGGTPRALYDLLATPARRQLFDWSRWQVFFGDERAVPPDDPQSNVAMAQGALLAHVPIPPAHVHRMEGDAADLDAAAAAYAELLERLAPASAGGPPQLDVVLLGLGENGHTASLFPGTAALDVTDRWVVPGRADYAPYERLTLTFPAINAAAAVAFLVTGASKGDALRGVVEGTVPAARVAPASGELHWFLDADAAAAVLR